MQPPIIAIVEAFTSGALFVTIVRAALERARDSWEKCRPPAPTAEVKTDPRGEAQAILEITAWNFAAAFDLVAGRIISGDGNADFWLRVADCLEIFQAGRELEASEYFHRHKVTL